ncbi:MAG: hypothetical protein ACREGR_05155, partial [Minisyncoccia bacterium]
PPKDEPVVNDAMRAAFERVGIEKPKDIIERKPQPLGSNVPGPEDAEPPAEKEGIPFVITRDMKQRLADLGYPKEERSNLTPQEIQDILSAERKFEKPAEPLAQPEPTTQAAGAESVQDPWRGKGGLRRAEQEIRFAVEVMNGGRYPESERAHVEGLLDTLHTASRSNDIGTYIRASEQLHDFADPYLKAYAEKKKTLVDPPPVERVQKETKKPDTAPSKQKERVPLTAESFKGTPPEEAAPAGAGAAPEPPRGDEAELARALDAWRLAEGEELLHPSEIPPAEQKQELAELLAQFGQQSLESDYLDAGVHNAGEAIEHPESPAENLKAKAERYEQEKEGTPITLTESEIVQDGKIHPQSGGPEVRVTREEALGANREAGPPTKEQFEKMKATLGARNAELDGRFGKLSDAGKWLLNRVEGYNKLNWKYKLAISGALIGGAALTSGALPTLSLVLAGIMYGQRALAGVGLYLNRRRALEQKALDEKSWFYKAGKAEQNMHAAIQAVLYMGATAAIGHEAIVGLEALGVGDWLSHLWPHQVSAPAHPGAEQPVSQFSSNDSNTADVDKAFSVNLGDHAPGAGAVPAPEIASGVPAAELPTITGGTHGYEGMVEELYARLHAPGASYVLPADHNSDLYKIMTATKEDIGAVAHRIAEDHAHNFYHAGDAKSVLIEKGSTLGFDSHGNLAFEQAGHGPAVEVAPENAVMTGGHPLAQPAAPDAEARHLTQVNAARANLGLPPVAHDTTLESNTVGAEFYAAHPMPEAAHPVPTPAEHLAPVTQPAHISIDSSRAHEYLTKEGARVVFGGSEADRQKEAFDWLVSERPKPGTAVYYEVTRRSLMSLGPATRHLAMMTWDGSAPSLPIIDPPNITELPGPDDLVTMVK